MGLATATVIVTHATTAADRDFGLQKPMDDRGHPVSPVARSVHPGPMDDLGAHRHRDETATETLTATATGRGIVIAIGTGNATVNGGLTDVDHHPAHQVAALRPETALPLIVTGNAMTDAFETMTATVTAMTGADHAPLD
ncbi:hypothetical protein Q8F55_001365 [Vanrija albida]|uniref:Asparaginase n=1 Tax=Vanrija albida TaxID=181172 RepID=A0ABR3QFT3_9TREE